MRKEMVETCPGCGAKIQFEHPGKPGFIPQDVYQRKLDAGEEIVCQRCFRLKNYKILTSEADEEEIQRFLSVAIRDFEKFVYVFDVFDFEGTFRPEIVKLLERQEVVFVANKFDTLPKTVSGSQLKSWLLEVIGKSVGIRPSQIFITSTKNGYGLSKLGDFLSGWGGKALILGVTNVGKSSLLQVITSSKVTVSPYPGTTIGLIEHRIGTLRLFDTPGIIVSDRLIDLFDPQCQAQILAKGEVSRKTFKPFPEEVIFVGGLVKIQSTLASQPDLRPIFQIFAPEQVTFHKTKNPEFINHPEKHFGRLLIPPCGRFDVSRLNFKQVEIIVKEEEELSIPGLCWINVKRGPVRFTLNVPENVEPKVRPALMKPKRKV
ncbi:ribosome biogenesis GTPase YqeH [Fervidobacterium thailandense]|uniref:Ribosome biogenesis GTPase YqeH n=1 Tax=Fervidobacterium thailandense TaxID=1008305 RepID=A0A1E3G0B2_9BACT|nr:ribosome biogenesis GTPase YqeH [Fervidobacterium thailandense]